MSDGVNEDVSTAILQGTAHVYFGLAGIFVLALLGFVLPNDKRWLVYTLSAAFAAGVFADLWSHGYTH